MSEEIFQNQEVLSNQDFGEQNSEGFGEEDDFDATEQKNEPKVPGGVLGIAANALAGGLGNAMGLEEDNQMDELTAMEMDMLEGNVAGEAAKDTKIKVRVYINMDEDDNNEKGVNINDQFKRSDMDKPFFVDIQISDHFNCKELIIDALDLFNNNIIGEWTLDDSEEKIDENYSLYIAKKKGGPKDDFPPLSLSSNVKKTNYDRFSLCCFSACFLAKGGNISPAPAAIIENQRQQEVILPAAPQVPEAHSFPTSLQTSAMVVPNQQQKRIQKNSSLLDNNEQALPASQGCCSQCSIF